MLDTSEKQEEKYRAFVSYSHRDQELARDIVKVLEGDDVGLEAIWDQNFAYGYGFHEQIKSFIAHAHVFVPVITATSSRRGWVHQEIGYAMALNIPVLPITLGILPGEMIQQLHAVQLGKGTEIEDLQKHLSRRVFDNLIGRYRDTSCALYECAELAEDRSRMMADYALSMLDLNKYGLVRQRGGLSSFHIPDSVISHAAWAARYRPQTRSPFHCRCLRGERLALGRHAGAEGCHIVVNPYLEYEGLCRKAVVVRLRSLVAFLQDKAQYPKVQVAFDPEMVDPESLTIVGDWFAAESVSASGGQGYRQTIFTTHAPSMLVRMKLFDEGFSQLLSEAGWEAEESREQAIPLIEKRIAELEKERCTCSDCSPGSKAPA